VRERKACWWFGTGEQTDCEEEVTGHVRRAVPITRSKLTIVLQMRWSHKKPIPAAGQHIDCSVAVPEQLGVALQRAAIQIRHKYGIRTVPARGDFANEVGLKESSVWPFGLNGLALVLNHYDLGRQLAARIKAAGGQRPDLESQMDGVYGPNATHPWVLWLSHADLKPRIPPELEQMRRALSEPHH
jgi:hypothetical protein